MTVGKHGSVAIGIHINSCMPDIVAYWLIFKVKTDHVMSILEKMHRGAGDVDMGSLSSAPCSDGVDVSTFGTVTFKQRPHSKPAIPNSIVDHDKVCFYLQISTTVCKLFDTVCL